jgi:PAS domain S-box-containing protein
MKFFAAQSYKKYAAPWTLLGACLLMVLHAGDLLLWGTQGPGPILSNVLQLLMGVLCVVAAYRASRVSEGFGRHFWMLSVAGFSLFVLAQGLASSESFYRAPHFIDWTVNVLFFFWFTPLAIALFLDEDFTIRGFDWLLALDLVQVLLFWFTGYYYFFYIPEQSTGTELARSVWAPYFIFVGFLIAGFVVRALLTKSAAVRSMYGRLATFLLAAGVSDYFFYYGPGKALPNGAWYDAVWVSNTFVFVMVAATWKAESKSGKAEGRPRRSLMVQSMPLLYSLLIVVICARIVQQRPGLAASVVLISFACSGARMLATQYRQQRVQQLLEAVIEGTNDAVFVKDREGRYLMANSAAAARVGRQPAELTGKTSRDLFPENLAAQFAERDRAALQAGENQTYEEQLDGVLTCLTTIGPFRDAQAKIAGTFGISRDITDRKRMEENLRVQKAFLEQLIQSAPEAIAITDPDYTVRQINLEFTRVFGYTVEEARGRNLGALIVPPSKEGESEQLAAFALHSVNTVLETTRRRKDGSRVEVSVLVSPVIVGNELDAVYCIYRDISDRKTTEEQLRQSQKMEAIGRLAGGLAHDLNNLLTVITGYSELQLAAFQANDPKHAQAAKINHAAERATGLTRQLLAFSRKQLLQPRALDLNSVVDSIQGLLWRLIGEDVEFAFVAADDLGTVHADPSQIEQVIMNLAINARDAMPKGGKLTLQTANVEIDAAYARVHVGLLPGRYVLLSVRDTGVGMDEETLGHAFEPFFTTKGLGKGTGLGLSTVYGIVQQSKGHVFVESEPGQGSLFKIYLPRVDEAVAQSVVKESAPDCVGKETILLVEDDPQVRELTATLLKSCGYTVLAADGMSGVEKHCREFRGGIDLLLSDMIMPGTNGKEVAEVVRRLRPGIRVLFMSGYTDDVIDHHGGLEPDTFFLQKPFTSTALAEKVRQALSYVPVTESRGRDGG